MVATHFVRHIHLSVHAPVFFSTGVLLLNSDAIVKVLKQKTKIKERVSCSYCVSFNALSFKIHRHRRGEDITPTHTHTQTHTQNKTRNWNLMIIGAAVLWCCGAGAGCRVPDFGNTRFLAPYSGLVCLSSYQNGVTDCFNEDIWEKGAHERIFNRTYFKANLIQIYSSRVCIEHI